jgi:hypothetical protein
VPSTRTVYPLTSASSDGVAQCDTGFRSHNGPSLTLCDVCSAAGANLKLRGSDCFGPASESSKRLAGILLELRNVNVLHFAGFAIDFLA